MTIDISRRERVMNYGIVCVVIYYVIFTTALLFAIAAHTKAPLVGIYPLFVTLPWSLIMLKIIPDKSLNSINPWLMFIVCSIPNALILYKIGYDNTRYKRQQITTGSTTDRD